MLHVEKLGCKKCKEASHLKTTETLTAYGFLLSSRQKFGKNTAKAYKVSHITPAWLKDLMKNYGLKLNNVFPNLIDFKFFSREP